MIRLVRSFAVVSVAGLVFASLALADVPSADHSTVPSCITLVGSQAGVPDAVTGQFLVVVRTLVDAPKNGASVVVDLSGCDDISICSNQLDPAATVNCAAKTVRKFTGIDGSVLFTVLGGSNGSGNATSLSGCARVYGNGTRLGSPTVAALDLDGMNGVGLNDLSVWLTDFGTGTSYGRDDFDHSGTVGINDLAAWLTQYGRGASTSSCVTACP